MLEDKVKFFKEKLNGLHDIFRRVSEKKSTNAQDKDEFSNFKADILMLYIEAVSSLVPEKNFVSDETSSMMDLFIELKNEFATFRKGIYSKVDSFSKLIFPTDVIIQNDDRHPSLQQEIIETELNSESSTYASVAQTSSATPEGKFQVLVPVIKDKRVNPKVVINGTRKDSGLKIVGKMPKRKAILLSRLGPETTVNDITNFLAPLNLKFLQCHRLKTKYQTHASFLIHVYENDLKQLLDSTVWPEGCLIAECYGKLRNDQISQEVIPRSDSNHPSCFALSTNTDSK
ncbi:hypothetical protein AVEN_72296-1 [Araneus ventricosus]|uniref:Uncharacterized protein n=1 Tax=Araneus ventricosus TaxID=182803 RepID=A0A4Y2TB87_ARAVE|nr:hypothetical protein AVEN_72296-1 [Araneus ventricosus]